MALSEMSEKPRWWNVISPTGSVETSLLSWEKIESKRPVDIRRTKETQLWI